MNTDDPIVLVELNQQPAWPTDDFSDDPLTDEDPADERVAIDDEAIDNLFADFDESTRRAT